MTGTTRVVIRPDETRAIARAIEADARAIDGIARALAAHAEERRYARSLDRIARGCADAADELDAIAAAAEEADRARGAWDHLQAFLGAAGSVGHDNLVWGWHRVQVWNPDLVRRSFAQDLEGLRAAADQLRDDPVGFAHAMAGLDVLRDDPARWFGELAGGLVLGVGGTAAARRVQRATRVRVGGAVARTTVGRHVADVRAVDLRTNAGARTYAALYEARPHLTRFVTVQNRGGWAAALHHGLRSWHDLDLLGHEGVGRNTDRLGHPVATHVYPSQELVSRRTVAGARSQFYGRFDSLHLAERWVSDVVRQHEGHLRRWLDDVDGPDCIKFTAAPSGRSRVGSTWGSADGWRDSDRLEVVLIKHDGPRGWYIRTAYPASPYHAAPKAKTC